MVFEARWSGALLLGLSLLGCSAVLDGDEDEPGTAEPVVVPIEDEQEVPPSLPPRASKEAPVFLKKAGQLEADLASALALPMGSVCRELGTEDCFEVHNIVLGGVEPYTLRIDRPMAEPSATTPLALERLVWGACEQAVARDLGPGPALVLVPGPEGLDRRASARRLAESLRHGPVEDEQLEVLVDFGSELGDQDWATSACVAVASAFGTIFY